MGHELQGADWHQQQLLEEERYRETVDALTRCAKAGVDQKALQILARECGVKFDGEKHG